ncbi:type IV pili methyl-accepting chemotaxis transducer N-terminal domain-containing protein [Tabrizicola sp.]|uniref:type IV pili methyl-accepting chemotaxis transducer N-terminal domain-containing protein n=1 Tax=Tabrizicola sp. TaxID=2005166 RepID=UPI003F3D7A9D
MTAIAKANLRKTMLLAVLLGSAGAVQAQVEYDGSKARVNLANKLQSLSETVNAASCRLQAGIDPEAAASLTQASRDFATILAAFEAGNPTMGIPTAETASRPLKALAAVTDIWTPLQADVEALIADPGATSAFEAIRAARVGLLDASGILASEMSGEYSNPQELLQSDAITLGIVGRQRMLIEGIVADLCLVATGNADAAVIEGLGRNVAMFDQSLMAMRKGMPAAGVSPPPSDAVVGALAELSTKWAAVKAEADTVVAAQEISPEKLLAVAEAGTAIFHDLENTITLYMLATPGVEGVYRLPLQTYADTELVKWVQNPDLIAAINEQNRRNANLTQEDIDALDKEWRAEAKGEVTGDLISTTLALPMSEWLLEQQNGTAGFVTEVFVMDNKGLNVAQSAVTSDYWQADEDKWQLTYANGGQSLHISEVEYDDSAKTYQSQISLPIFDPATGELIGAVTFGINVQSLL